MGKRIEQAFKSLLGKSGYSKKASNEVWKWYRSPLMKRKAAKDWHSKAKPVDQKKTKVTLINLEELET